MANPFNRPKRALSSAPEATPYHRARQVLDDRMGLAIGHARNWRPMAFANLGVAPFLALGWWTQAARATVKPYVLEVASWGQTQKITALDGVYRPATLRSPMRSRAGSPTSGRSQWIQWW